MAGRESIAHEHPRVFSARVKQIELRTRGLVESLFSGEYRSVFKGRGLEFSEVREYQPGDDIRSIDWNVTARRGRLFIKQHEEERELTAMLMVDLSGSQDFGTGLASNARIASEIACILALSAARNNDHVGLLVVTDQTELFIPPDTGRRHALRLIFELLSLEPTGRRTRLSPGLEFLAKVLRRRAAVFLISDFLVDLRGRPPPAAHREPLQLPARPGAHPPERSPGRWGSRMWVWCGWWTRSRGSAASWIPGTRARAPPMRNRPATRGSD